jgi:hypothetical protein
VFHNIICTCIFYDAHFFSSKTELASAIMVVEQNHFIGCNVSYPAFIRGARIWCISLKLIKYSVCQGLVDLTGLSLISLFNWIITTDKRVWRSRPLFLPFYSVNNICRLFVDSFLIWSYRHIIYQPNAESHDRQNNSL